MCFKDLGQQALVRFLDHFLTSPKTLVASTTGDTGPAALEAVRSLASKNLRLIVGHPYGQISDFQRRQMTTIPKTLVTFNFDTGGIRYCLRLRMVSVKIISLVLTNSFSKGKKIRLWSSQRSSASVWLCRT